MEKKSHSILVYIPATLPRLEEFLQSETIHPVSSLVFGVTPQLREEYVYDEEEELEHIAFLAATDGSLRLIADEILANADNDKEQVYARRVVISAQISHAQPRLDLDDCALSVSEPIALESVTAIYVDDKEVQPLVQEAAYAIDEADLGSEDAQFVIDELHDKFLSWYSVEEVPFLIDLIS